MLSFLALLSEPFATINAWKRFLFSMSANVVVHVHLSVKDFVTRNANQLSLSFFELSLVMNKNFSVSIDGCFNQRSRCLDFFNILSGVKPAGYLVCHAVASEVSLVGVQHRIRIYIDQLVEKYTMKLSIISGTQTFEIVFRFWSRSRIRHRQSDF